MLAFDSRTIMFFSIFHLVFKVILIRNRGVLKIGLRVYPETFGFQLRTSSHQRLFPPSSPPSLRKTHQKHWVSWIPSPSPICTSNAPKLSGGLMARRGGDGGPGGA
jgi:hypothetical protein